MNIQSRPRRTAPGAFTKTSVAALRPPTDKDVIFAWDEALPGFGIALRKSGKRVWVAQWRGLDGRTRRMTLGDARTVSLEDARREARKKLSRATLGNDPAAERQAERHAVTVLEMVEAYLKAAASSQRPSSFKNTTLHLRKHAKPLHNLSAGQVEQSDVTKMLAAISVKHPIAANRCRAALSKMWNWALGAGFINKTENPVANVPKPGKEKSRDRVLRDEEVVAIWHCTTGTHDYDRLVRLALLTGARRAELGSMVWSEITLYDDGTGTWTLPAARAKNDKAHIVPLVAAAVAQLPPQRKERAAVFGKRAEGTGFSGWSSCQARLVAQVEAAITQDFAQQHGRQPKDGELVVPGWTFHDLRRTLATGMQKIGVRLEVTEALLNHISGSRAGINGIYQRYDWAKEKVEALQAWSKHLAGLIATNKPSATTVPPAKVEQALSRRLRGIPEGAVSSEPVQPAKVDEAPFKYLRGLPPPETVVKELADKAVRWSERREAATKRANAMGAGAVVSEDERTRAKADADQIISDAIENLAKAEAQYAKAIERAAAAEKSVPRAVVAARENALAAVEDAKSLGSDDIDVRAQAAAAQAEADMAQDEYLRGSLICDSPIIADGPQLAAEESWFTTKAWLGNIGMTVDAEVARQGRSRGRSFDVPRMQGAINALMTDGIDVRTAREDQGRAAAVIRKSARDRGYSATGARHVLKRLLEAADLATTGNRSI